MANFEITVVPDLQSFLMQLAATLLLYLVARHFLYKPIKDYLARRDAHIEQDFTEAKQAKETAMALKEQYETILATAKEEATKIVSDARAHGDEIKAKAAKDSKEEADRIYQRGVASLELERQKVLTELNSEIVDMAMAGAQKVLQAQADQDVDRQLVEKFVAQMGASHE